MGLEFSTFSWTATCIFSALEVRMYKSKIRSKQQLMMFVPNLDAHSLKMRLLLRNSGSGIRAVFCAWLKKNCFELSFKPKKYPSSRCLMNKAFIVLFFFFPEAA